MNDSPHNATDTVELSRETASYQAWQGRPLPALMHERDRVQHLMTEAVNQAGPDMDYARITALAGSATEKAAAVMNMHGDLAGVERAIRESRQAMAAVERIMAGGHEDEDAAAAQEGALAHGEPLLPSLTGALVERGYNSVDAFLASASFGSGFEIALPGDVSVLNALFQGSSYTPDTRRQPGITLTAQRPVQLIDVLPSYPAPTGVWKYDEETTFTPGAARVAEGATIPDATFAVTERTKSVEKVAARVTSTYEALQDNMAAEGYLRDRVTFGVMQAADGKLVDGAVANDVTGLVNVAGTSSQTYAGTLASPTHRIEDLKRAKTKVSASPAYATPTLYVMNEVAYDDILLETGSDGHFKFALNPTADMVPRLWGLPVAMASKFADGNAANEKVGAVLDATGMFVHLVTTGGLRFEVGYLSNDFRDDKKTLKAVIRMQLIARRPSAICIIQVPAA